jgi:type I restriction enzyme, S subunit
MQTLRARYLFRLYDERLGDRELPLLSVSSTRGVVRRADITKDLHRADDLANYKVCYPGDVVVNRMSAYQGALGMSRWTGIVSPDYIVLHPTGGVEPRWLHHLMRSSWFVSEMASRVRGIGTIGTSNVRTPRVSAEEIGEIVVQVPLQHDQCAIADYLDTETARIDALIEKKRRMVELLSNRFSSWREKVMIYDEDVVWTPLHHLTDATRPIVYGIVQAGEEVEDGVPYIKTGDMMDFRPELLSKTSREIDFSYRRARVVPGDIVIAMRASIGLPVIVPTELPVANLTQGTARVAARFGVDNRWLFHILQSRAVQEQCQNRAVGTTFKTLNIWDLRRISIPTPHSERQTLLAAKVDESSSRMSRTVGLLNAQIGYLAERRQALITSAVTGGLDTPEVAP